MSGPLIIALYSGIAFAIYFIICYFNMFDDDDFSIMMGCAAWPIVGGFWAVVAGFAIVIGGPVGICYLLFQGVKILAEQARGPIPDKVFTEKEL